MLREVTLHQQNTNFTKITLHVWGKAYINIIHEYGKKVFQNAFNMEYQLLYKLF